MHPAKWAQRVEPYIPPKLFAKAYYVSALFQILQHSGLRELRRNEALRGKLRGKRAFVIGNGPSLSKMDLTRLRDENIFTVNSFFRHARTHGLRPVAHSFIDADLFVEPYLTSDLKEFAATRDPSTLCFAPLDFEHLIRPMMADAHYLLMAGRIENNSNLDITGILPGLQTVTLAALVVALFMGCSPIYVIGCDVDLLSHVVAVNPLRIRESHFYDHAHDIVVDVPQFDYAGYGQAVWRMLLGYRLINERRAPEQKIYNAGVGGLLDVFERVDFESLFT
jgi:hypothetical protein